MNNRNIIHHYDRLRMRRSILRGENHHTGSNNKYFISTDISLSIQSLYNFTGPD